LSSLPLSDAVSVVLFFVTGLFELPLPLPPLSSSLSPAVPPLPLSSLSVPPLLSRVGDGVGGLPGTCVGRLVYGGNGVGCGPVEIGSQHYIAYMQTQPKRGVSHSGGRGTHKTLKHNTAATKTTADAP